MPVPLLPPLSAKELSCKVFQSVHIQLTSYLGNLLRSVQLPEGLLAPHLVTLSMVKTITDQETMVQQQKLMCKSKMTKHIHTPNCMHVKFGYVCKLYFRHVFSYYRNSDLQAGICFGVWQIEPCERWTSAPNTNKQRKQLNILHCFSQKYSTVQRSNTAANFVKFKLFICPPN